MGWTEEAEVLSVLISLIFSQKYSKTEIYFPVNETLIPISIKRHFY